MGPIAFIDIEASGLGPYSYPIEIGWAFASGEAHGHFVRPEDHWRYWDPEAEAIHRIRRDDLFHHGESVDVVAWRLNKALSHCTVYSKVPLLDQMWLEILFSNSRHDQRFAVRDMAELFARMRGFDVMWARATAHSIAPMRHRAAADAVHLATIYRLVSGG